MNLGSIVALLMIISSLCAVIFLRKSKKSERHKKDTIACVLQEYSAEVPVEEAVHCTYEVPKANKYKKQQQHTTIVKDLHKAIFSVQRTYNLEDCPV